MDPLALMGIVSITTAEWVIILAAVVAFFVMRIRRSSRTDVIPPAPIFPRGLVVIVGIMGLAANLLFLAPLTAFYSIGPLEDLQRPFEVLPAWSKYAIVAAVGVIIQVVFLVCAARWVQGSRGIRRGLDPHPRSWGSFLPRGATAIGATLFALLAVTTVLAGVASTSDPSGRFNFIRIDTPDGYAEGLFPGWFYTIPALIAAVLLTVLAVASLALIARPANPQGEDDSPRRQAASQVASVTLAALAITLGRLWIFAAQGGTTTTQVTTENGSAWIVPSFQATTPLLGAAGAILVGLGLAGFALLVLPARTRSRAPIAAGAQ